MKKKNIRNQSIHRLGAVEYVPAPNLDDVPMLIVPGPEDDRLAAVKERLKSTRPPVTSWVDELGSLIVQDNIGGTKTLTRECHVCQRWFRIVRGAKGSARWPGTCSEPCKTANRRKVDAERQRLKRARDKMPTIYRYDTIDCDVYSKDLPRLLRSTSVAEVDGVVHKVLSPKARAAAETYLREQEEWESWARD